MENLGQNLSDTMRAIAAALQYPVVFVLLVLVAVTLVLLGTLLVELFTEHKQLRENMPRLADALRREGEDTAATIEGARLLKSQKALLLELTRHPALTETMREALSDRLIEEESNKYQRRVMLTDLISKLGPMFGLLGTLIPLGPGIIALGDGDTYTLSQALLTAFDTTILGLITAAVSLVISTVRKKWYANYMSVLETLADCILEVEAHGKTAFEAPAE